MKKNSYQNIDNLSEGLQIIVSKYRGSFSDCEIVLLKECISALKTLKEQTTLSVIDKCVKVAKVVELLGRVFLLSQHLKDLF